MRSKATSGQSAPSAASSPVSPVGQAGPRLSSEERFAARSRARRRAPWRRLLILLAVGALVGGLVWLAWFSPYLVVEEVSVEGVTGDEAAAVQEIAAVPMGLQLARVDTDAVTARMRERPTIAEARTIRSWPNGITLSVRPRTPALVLQNPQGQLKVADATGLVYKEVDQAPEGVPVVTADSSEGESTDAIKAALSLVRTLPEDLAAQVSTITVSSANLVTFTVGGVEVTWGGADRPERKVEVLRALLATGPEGIDVSAPDTPTTR